MFVEIGSRLMDHVPFHVWNAYWRMVGANELRLQKHSDQDGTYNMILRKVQEKLFLRIPGELFVYRVLVRLGGLKPNERVLDVGCGAGLIALPLTKYLRHSGSYEGLDIVAHAIDWCRENITPRNPNFQFRVADVYNKAYNPKGKYKGYDWRFPYKDETFDLVFLKSVFTHMLPDDIENYLSEISRVLKRGGRCIISFFLLNAQSLEAIEIGRSRLSFKYDADRYRTVNNDVPESCVAYHESFVRGLFGKYCLNIREPIRYGSWWRRTGGPFGIQDFVLAMKS